MEKTIHRNAPWVNENMWMATGEQNPQYVIIGARDQVAFSLGLMANTGLKLTEN